MPQTRVFNYFKQNKFQEVNDLRIIPIFCLPAFYKASQYTKRRPFSGWEVSGRVFIWSSPHPAARERFASTALQ